jgi:hypothetical protein
MSKHTPTPWNNSTPPDKMIICDAEGGSIADCAPAGPWITHKQGIANADLIIKAVNNHDALTAARKTFLGYLQAENGCKRSGIACRETCGCELELQGLVAAWGGAVSEPNR